MKKSIACEDKYEAKKLSGLIYAKENKESFITGILEVIDNEVIISVKDKSAHSILLKDKFEVESFADFIQSVIEEKHRITNTTINNDVVEITKE
ncbi:MAG: hypothetical protein ACT4N5_06050 [Nitrosopumilaceae archaeon]